MSRSIEQFSAEMTAEISSEDMTTGMNLVAEGWVQISRRHRMVARLPKGKTGLQALQERDLGAYKRLMERVEREAASTFLRVYSNREGERRELTLPEFAAFRKLGGEAV